MNRLEQLKTSGEVIESRARFLASRGSKDDIKCEYHKTFGYICALHDVGILDDEQFYAAEDVLAAALSEAIEKAASGATSTRSGSEGGPEKDHSLNHNPIITIFHAFVKGGDSKQEDR